MKFISMFVLRLSESALEKFESIENDLWLDSEPFRENCCM